MRLSLNAVVLRPPRAADSHFLAALWNDPGVFCPSQPAAPTPLPEPVFAARIAGGQTGFFNGGARDVEWVVTHASDQSGAPVGVAGLYGVDPHNRMAEIGVVIGEASARRSGLGVDTMVLLAKHAFRGRGLHGVYAQIKGSNVPAIGTCERLGLPVQGVLREHRFIDGARDDLHLYGLLASEWDDGLERWRERESRQVTR